MQDLSLKPIDGLIHVDLLFYILAFCRVFVMVSAPPTPSSLLINANALCGSYGMGENGDIIG